MVCGDDLRPKTPAHATYFLAAICAVLAAVPLNPTVLGFTPLSFSLHPVRELYTLFSAQFLHVGLAHLIGNMIFLISFGRAVESLVGSVIFVLALIGLGAFAFLGSWPISPNSPTPIIGMSGSLLFLLGAYSIVFPRAKLRLFPSFLCRGFAPGCSRSYGSRHRSCFL